MRKIPILAPLMPALAASPPAWGQEAQNLDVTEMIVYGDDPCPRSSAEEIIVCVRRPEQERYRIPRPFRTDPADPARESWAVRADRLEYVGESGILSCSPSGPGGWTGCWEEMMRQATRDRPDPDGPPPN